MKDHEFRYGKQAPNVGYSRVKLMEELYYDEVARDRFQLLRKRPEN